MLPHRGIQQGGRSRTCQRAFDRPGQSGGIAHRHRRMLTRGGKHGPDIGRAVGRDDMRATGQCLDQRRAQPFPTGRLEQKIGLSHQPRQALGIPDIAGEVDTVSDAERVRLSLQRRAQRSFARDR